MCIFIYSIWSYVFITYYGSVTRIILGKGQVTNGPQDGRSSLTLPLHSTRISLCIFIHIHICMCACSQLCVVYMCIYIRVYDTFAATGTSTKTRNGAWNKARRL